MHRCSLQPPARSVRHLPVLTKESGSGAISDLSSTYEYRNFCRGACELGRGESCPVAISSKKASTCGGVSRMISVLIHFLSESPSLSVATDLRKLTTLSEGLKQCIPFT